MLQTDRLTAVRAQFGPHRVECAAIVAKNFRGVEGIDLDLRTAILTVCTQVLEAFEIAALTCQLPI